MKRKKIYSMLALGMAISLTVSIPASAAVSVNTGAADFPVTGETGTETKEDNQVVQTGKDEAGDVVVVVIPESVDSSNAINGMVNSETSTSLQGGSTVVVAVPEEVAPEQKDGLVNESKDQFKAIKTDEIKADRPGLEIQVTPVAPTVQSVAKNAAISMAEKMGLNVENPDTGINLAASADISIPNLAKGDTARVTIPMTEAPDTAKYEYYVLHYNDATGEWETLDASVTAEGIVVATFKSFSPVFVVKAERAVVAPPSDNDNTEDNNDDDSSSDNGSGNSGGSSASAGNTKNDTTPASAPAAPAAPANPAVSPKTGE